MAKFGSILAQGIIDAGKFNTGSLLSYNAVTLGRKWILGKHYYNELRL